MANWRQIQARIRKAKNSADAPLKLADLFEKTRDGMVAFELALLHEKAGQNEECIRWYSKAAQRFRRDEWKKKAEDALTRLGAPIPDYTTSAQPVVEIQADEPAEEETETSETFEISASGSAFNDSVDEDEESDEQPTAQPASAPQTQTLEPRRRRRGRRGGRGRRKKGAGEASNLPSQVFADTKTSRTEALPERSEPSVSRPSLDRRDEAREAERMEPPMPVASHHTVAHAEPVRSSIRSQHGRAGEPALASRLAQLESTLRRLVSSLPHQLDQADEAPAGPGVFLLSDSDLITSYYVEACQTLRVALGHLLRGARGPRQQAGASLKARLAEHLGINESKVSDYMRKHCVVRWIQLDEEAPYFASFVIGVLRTPMNTE